MRAVTLASSLGPRGLHPPATNQLGPALTSSLGGGVELTPQTLSEVEKVELGSASPCPSLGLSQREREEGRREEKREIAEICLVSG